MIETKEALVDPVAYFKANISNPQNLIEDGSLLIAGADFEVICRGTDYAINERRSPNHPISPILGNLYIRADARSVPHNGQQYNLDWFSAARAANTIAERMGRQPGRDIFRFTLSRLGVGLTPVHDFTAHIASGEFGRSCVLDRFDHDRNQDHALGALLMPIPVFNRIHAAGMRAFDAGNNHTRWFRHLTVRAAHAFDRSTFVIGRWAAEAYGGKPLSTYLDENDRFFARFNGFSDYDKGRTASYVLGYMTEHFEKVFPVIERLKKESVEVPVTD